jgi:MtrB/PioB family decaheme-associated outer membrane protein
MRSAHTLLLASLALAAGAPAWSQGTQAPAGGSGNASGATGEVDFGAQITSGLDEVGRFQRFEDRRTSPTMRRLRLTRDRNDVVLEVAFDNLGHRDQRYAASVERVGKLKASFEWNQVPLWYGGVTASPFREASPGVFRLDDSSQLAVQNRTATVAGAHAGAVQGLELRSRRDLASARVVYNATRSLDLSASFTSTARQGAMPWGASFGFNNDLELPVTVDHRTSDVNTAAEWSNAKGMVRVAYDGSFFDNAVETVVWDNPLRATDQTHATAYVAGDASSQGRMALWPDSSAHTVSATGSVGLPSGTRLFGSVSVGSWLQNGLLLPHTVNTAVQSIPLPRSSAEADARIVSMLYRVTSRPVPTLWLNGQFKFYDYDVQTPHFAVHQYVRLDGNVATSVTGGSEAFDLRRHFVDLDASFTPLRFVAFRAGYGRERDNRTYRVFERTTENVVRASIDATGLAWGSVRVQYDHAVRTGDGLDEQVLSDIGEQVSLRQFDISNRTRDRVSAIVQVLASNAVGLSASLAIGQEHRPEAAFGLQDNDLRAVTVGVDLAPGDAIDLGVTYGFENLSTLQRSRQANPGPQFNDPTRDWSTDVNEDVHTWTAVLGLPRVTSRTAVHASYDYVRSSAAYRYLLPVVTTLATPQQLPDVFNAYHRATAEVRYAFTRQLALTAGYWLDKYVVEDFGRSPATLNTALIPAFVNLMYQWRPYDVHTGRIGLIYRF